MTMPSATSREQVSRPFSQFVAVFLCGTFAFLDLYSTQPLLPLLSRVFDATETHVALTISASTVGVAITSFLLATFGQGLQRKRMIVVSIGNKAAFIPVTTKTLRT